MNKILLSGFFKKMTVSSAEINILIQRYFQELGYSHSAFAFGSESKIKQHEVANRQIPAGSLIYLIQKGIMFAQIDSAAHEAAGKPEELFGQELNYLRANFRQSVEIAEEVSQSTRRTKVYHTDTAEVQPNILSYHSSLFLHGHFAPVTVTAWSEDGLNLAAGSCDGTVVVWTFDNINKSDCVVSEKTFYLNPSESEEETSDITALKWSKDVLAVGTFNGSLSLYKNGKMSCQLIEHNTPVITLDFIGDVLVSGSLDGTILVSKDNAILNKYKLDGGELTDITHIDDQKILISCGKSVYIINSEENEPKQLFTSPEQIVCMSIDSKRESVVIVDSDKTATYYTVSSSAKREESIQAPGCSLAFLQNGNYVYGLKNGAIKIMTPQGELHTSFEIYRQPPHSIAIDPKGRFFATASAEGLVCIFDIEAANIATAYIADEPVNGLSWGPTGRLLCINLNSGAVAVIDFEQLC